MAVQHRPRQPAQGICRIKVTWRPPTKLLVTCRCLNSHLTTLIAPNASWVDSHYLLTHCMLTNHHLISSDLMSETSMHTLPDGKRLEVRNTLYS